MDRNMLVAIMRSLFIAQKLIASRWVSPNPLTLGDWIREVDKYVTFEKHTYVRRNIFWKFEIIWKKWIDVSCSHFTLNPC